MRRFTLLLLLVASLASAHLYAASRRITVQELAQRVTDAHADQMTDKKLAASLKSTHLSEWMDASILDQLVERSPGPQTAQSLRALYADSAFLPFPEESSNPVPSAIVQKQIVSRMTNYVTTAIAALPNLTATRSTTFFVDSIAGYDSIYFPKRGDLFLIKQDHRKISVQHGIEFVTLPAQTVVEDYLDARSDANGDRSYGPALYRETLHSWGDYGPVLSIVVKDSTPNGMIWSGWQRLHGMRMATFHFDVPRSDSHFTVRVCCEDSVRKIGKTSSHVETNFLLVAGYHGEVVVEPETGRIRIIRLQTEMPRYKNILGGGMLIQWNPKEIGSYRCLCVTHSVDSLTMVDRWYMHSSAMVENRRHINENEYHQYHRFGSKPRIVGGSDPGISSGISGSHQSFSDSLQGQASSSPHVPPH